MTKKATRARVRHVLRGMTPAARATASAGICGRIRALPQWASARMVALYSPLESEVDVTPLLEAPGERTFCFPRVSGRTLEFHLCAHGELKAGPWNLREPDAGLHDVGPPGSIDLILVPGLAFTAAGARLGRGGGFYDRYLPGVRGTKIGVCFAEQLLDELPSEAHDHEVDIVISK
jgi:5-formyltetrahydrofolate cyclo-ligase